MKRSADPETGELFVELTRDIPDLNVRAAALLARATGHRMAAILGAQGQAPESTTSTPPPVPPPRRHLRLLRDQALMWNDGIVNRA
ncbi:MAG: hypothetical protein H6739_41175 [Alphaproteobacteria bacterium]|nr:hypothetical protein [Alphaproteobacteria bacterium]